MQFWGDCILTVTYLLNRTPTQLLQGLTHYELLFKTSPDFTNINFFGSLCYVSNLSSHKNKFSDRTRQVLTSRDVQFVEHVFPFASLPLTDSSANIFHHLILFLMILWPFVWHLIMFLKDIILVITNPYLQLLIFLHPMLYLLDLKDPRFYQPNLRITLVFLLTCVILLTMLSVATINTS